MSQITLHMCVAVIIGVVFCFVFVSTAAVCVDIPIPPLKQKLLFLEHFFLTVIKDFYTICGWFSCHHTEFC